MGEWRGVGVVMKCVWGYESCECEREWDFGVVGDRELVEE
jgi:hypothetical protein